MVVIPGTAQWSTHMNKGQPPTPGARGWDRIAEAPRDVTHTLFRIPRLSWQEGSDRSVLIMEQWETEHRQGVECPGLMLGGVEADSSTVQGSLLQG